MNEYKNIPPNTIKTIQDYVEKGWEPGDFVRAVLMNDLKMAYAAADMNNKPVLEDIIKYCYNEIPSNCWGNAQKVYEWIKKKEEERKQMKPKSDFRWNLFKIFGLEAIFIEDLNLGNMSVTNDIENVLKEIKKQVPDLGKYIIQYYDSEKIVSEIEVDNNGEFIRFK